MTEKNTITKGEKTKELRGKYISTIGRRKTAVAQVRLYKNGKGHIVVNDLAFDKYFPTFQFKNIIMQPLKLGGLEKKLDFSILVKGGGKKGQAEAVRLGIARSLIAMNKGLKPTLKKAGLLTRDSRKKERKKPGLKKARRAPQWSKR